jgi:hypothetical protein
MNTCFTAELGCGLLTHSRQPMTQAPVLAVPWLQQRRDPEPPLCEGPGAAGATYAPTSQKPEGTVSTQPLSYHAPTQNQCTCTSSKEPFAFVVCCTSDQIVTLMPAQWQL